MLKELWNYRQHIFHPEKRFMGVSPYSGIIQYYHGTYVKPVAMLKRWWLKRQGWKVRLRGRGQRSGKYQNYTHDIRIQDSLFLAVYAQT